MTDRELLELAAKAACIQIYRWHGDGGYYWTGRDADDKDRNPGLWIRWNPLRDDGDALRLAVKLKFNFAYKPQDTDNHRPIPSGVTVWLRHPASYGLSHTKKLPAFVFEQHNDDHYAATRRAIVRAAAEIGKVMP